MPLQKILKWLNSFFNNKKSFSIGLYGNVNTGKSTLANKISKDWSGEEMSSVSEIPHETRTVVSKEKISIEVDGKKIVLNLLDMPGITTKVDYREFVEKGLTVKEAQKRAKEATRGIIEAIKWLEHVNVALVVMDATEDPFTQVNLTILGNLEARKIPVIIVANKIDKKKAKPERIKEAFPQHKTVYISALKGTNINELYKTIANVKA
ncbi:GTP-binding protein [Candidatus Micrarchaeota archaeon]|nr:GTP-binding protein [Candidatus Micrarchaeota archaeon]